MSSNYLTVLGRQPELSLAELSAVTQGKAKPHSSQTALLEAKVDLGSLGGTQKLGRIITAVEGVHPSAISRALWDYVKNFDKTGKFIFGISIYPESAARDLAKVAWDLKKQLRAGGQSVRMVPAKQAQLSTAQVIHNRLASKGYEFIISIGPKDTLIAQTEEVQDIASYGQRDFGRPCRPAKIGMLPPKLAQIMLNLALGPRLSRLSLASRLSLETEVKSGGRQAATIPEKTPSPTYYPLPTTQRSALSVLDPFCGSGVVLQEALLAGFNAQGSDISKDMVTCSQTNLDWIIKDYAIASKIIISRADATKATFPQPIDAVVSEIYLGPPLTHPPHPNELKDIKNQVNQLLRDFLHNLHTQIKTATPVVLAVPFWQTTKGPVRLDVIDRLESLGYNYSSFPPVNTDRLDYRRADQIVGRQLLTLIKI